MSVCNRVVSAVAYLRIFFTERLAEGKTCITRKRGREYECPYPHCKGSSYDRLADHLSSVHNLKGEEWKPLRHRLLNMAHTEDWNDLYKEEEEMLDLLPRKAEDFKGETISIDYLKEDTDQTAEQLALPLPKWANEENLKELLDGQDQSDADSIFGRPKPIRPQMEEIFPNVKRRAEREAERTERAKRAAEREKRAEREAEREAERAAEREAERCRGKKKKRKKNPFIL